MSLICEHKHCGVKLKLRKHQICVKATKKLKFTEEKLNGKKVFNKSNHFSFPGFTFLS